MKKLIVSLAALAALSSAAFADTKNTQTGCGLGAQVFKTEPQTAVMYSIQGTLNGTGSQSIGITLGTSGCKKTQFVMNERAEQFVASNMDQLAKEIAMGQGESVDTLAELLSVEDKETFASALQSNYNSIYTSKNAEMADVLDNISAM